MLASLTISGQLTLLSEQRWVQKPPEGKGECVLCTLHKIACSPWGGGQHVAQASAQRFLSSRVAFTSVMVSVSVFLLLLLLH